MTEVLSVNIECCVYLFVVPLEHAGMNTFQEGILTASVQFIYLHPKEANLWAGTTSWKQCQHSGGCLIDFRLMNLVTTIITLKYSKHITHTHMHTRTLTMVVQNCVTTQKHFNHHRLSLIPRPSRLNFLTLQLL